MLTYADCRRQVAAARAWRSQGDSAHTHTPRTPRLNWPSLRARPGPHFTCFTALLVLVPRVTGVTRVDYRRLSNPNARDGGRVSAGTQFTCFTALLVLGSQFTVCSSGTRMRGTAGGCRQHLALRPLSVRSKPPPSPGTQFKFACFTSTTVQILTPEELRGCRTGHADGNFRVW